MSETWKRQPQAMGERERGSALVMSIFVLFLLAGMGTALLFLSQHEARMGQASLRVKKAFFLAEGAVETGRTKLYLVNGDGPFNDDLDAAAGVDNVIDFDPDLVTAVYDSDGNVTGLQGFGDDVPVQGLTPLWVDGDGGSYAAFLTNDPVDGVSNKTDTNDRVMITGIGAGGARSFEVAQAIVEPFHLLPTVPAAAMTLLGPNPSFDNGNSNAQRHTGNNCGVPGGAFAPIVGTISSAANSTVQDDMNRPNRFTSGPGPFVGEDTIGDLTNPADPIVVAAGHGTIDPIWQDCQALKEMVEFLATVADYYCNTDLQSCSLPATSPGDVVFIDGDLTNTPNADLTGILVVTGKLTYKGNTGWDGAVLVIGEGDMLRNGGGNGKPSGAVVVANIDPTPDGPVSDRSDWCTTGTDGFGQIHYDVTGGGNSEVEWCTAWLDSANPVRAYKVTEFLQR